MRYLVKSDYGIPLPDETMPSSNLLTRRWTHGRRILAILFLLLGGLFGLQFLQNSSATDHSGMAFTPEWDDPSAAFSWFLGRVNGWAWQVRSGIGVALPPGNYRLMLKIAICAVAAAVFLHSPRKN